MEKDRRREGIWIETGDAPPGARRRSRAAFVKEHGSAIWRLFFIQSSRNERTLDGLGFFSIIAPFISGCARPGEDAKAFARRHLGYFNAGLYLSSAVAGVVVNLERQARPRRTGHRRADREGQGGPLVRSRRPGQLFFRRASHSPRIDNREHICYVWLVRRTDSLPRAVQFLSLPIPDWRILQGCRAG